VFKGFVRPWHFGVLWNRDGRIARPLMAALARLPGVVVGDNQPYSARDHHGFTLHHHAERPGLPHVLVELRQDLIDTHRGAALWAGRLGDALEPILADPRLYRAEAAA
jgi:predicted N-formylglutamate amidohydrolase